MNSVLEVHEQTADDNGKPMQNWGLFQDIDRVVVYSGAIPTAD